MVYAFFQTSAYFWITTTIYHATLVILLAIWIKHTYNTVSDLCTKQRSSVKHRAKQPSINMRYTFSTLLTELCITGYTITTILAVFARWKYFTSITSCTFMTKSASIIYTLSKASLYTLFLALLHSVYGSSAYRYSPKLLITAGIINVIYCIVFSTLIGLYGFVNPHTGDISVGILCNPSFPKWFIISFGAYDIILSVSFMVAFNYPLSRATKDHKAKQEQIKELLIKTGVRTKILIWTAVISTMLILAFMAIVGSAMFIPVDTVINCVCICLMTPYYSVKYYKCLCAVCICCYGQTRSNDSNEKEMVSSISVAKSDDGLEVESV